MLADLRLAFRSLSRSPLFAAVAVASLALGLGANTAIFSLFDQILLRPLAVRNPHQLVLLEWPAANRAMMVGQGTFSYPMYKDLGSYNRLFSTVLARHPVYATLAQAGGQAFRVYAEMVSGNYFEALGVRAHLGRTLVPSDDRTPGAHPVVVLSYDFWKNQFGSDPALAGRTIRINGQLFEVAGVVEPGFHGLQIGFFPALYVPLMMKRAMTPTWDRLFDRRALWLNLFARLKPGVSRQQAQAALQPYYQSVLEEEAHLQSAGAATEFRRRFAGSQLRVVDGAGGIPFWKREAETPLKVLLAMAGLVLLISCANVANLLLARAAARQRELRIRLALGAGRYHLVRQLLAESALLAAAGGLAGLVLAAWTAEGVLRLLPPEGVRMSLSAQLDWRVLLYSSAVVIATGLLCGLLPAGLATRSNLAPQLREQASTPGRAGMRSKKALVVAQVALSLLMLAGSGLFLRTLLNLRSLDLGFRTANLLLFRVDAPLAGYKAGQAVQIYGQLRERLAAVPGVAGAVIAESSLLTGNTPRNTIRIEGYQPLEGTQMSAFFNSVSEGFFESLGMPILEGREFTAADVAAAPKVAVVNERFARHYFGGESPIGRRLEYHDYRYQQRGEAAVIVGVVRDGRASYLRDESERSVYVPYRQVSGIGAVTFYLRTGLEAEAMIQTLRRETGRAFPGLAVVEPRLIQMQVEELVAGERVVATLCLAFGVLATLLAAVGLYGVMAWSVARRTHEIGIRLALGARPPAVLGMVLREVAWLAAAGVAAGVPTALVLARLVRSQLYGLAPHDPLTFAGAALLVSAVALLAGFLPARRASRVDPLLALRYE